jgi:hypothetical protein
MLDKKIFVEGIAIFSCMPKSNTLNLESKFVLDIWYAALSDIANDIFQKACILIFQTSKWHPSVSEIRDAVKRIHSMENRLENSPEEQWIVFRSAVVSSPGSRILERIYNDSGTYFSDCVTDAVAKSMYKDFAVSNISESGNWRARFINSYNAIRLRHIEEVEYLVLSQTTQKIQSLYNSE